ncbi:unnamed protein product [Penicillium salamii]|nr:unnamed protein product [Penicillium salamii]CAG8297631.1 unnamed protein product [Penicillium salamii]CAG8401242.1 unnamed protein product [Penicillium salamii]
MLKPFHIRDLRSHPEPASPSNPALIRISTTDYDDIASNHPRARLTYVDEDDDGDETITVGSALELSQRLEEPLDLSSRVESVQLQSDVTPRHMFDVRRTNSVTELWKRFEDNHNDNDDAGDHTRDEPAVTEPDAQHGQRDVPASRDSSRPPASDAPRPLMEAFEAELAEMLGAAESSEKKTPRSDSPPIAEPFSNSSSGRAPHPVEIIAAQVMHQLTNGANMVQNEWRSRLPELQRQLQNAQRQLEDAHRSLPRNVETSLRALLATLEAHMRTAFNNIPDGGRQMAEDAFQAGRPVAENAADGLRMMASEFNEVGRTLFSAFECEFGRPGPASSSPSNTEPTAAGPAYPQAPTPQAPTYPSNEKSMPDSGESKSESAAPCPNYLYAPEGVPSHFPPPLPHHPLPHTNNLAPTPFPAPAWHPFQTFNPPPPPYPSHPPMQQPLAWPQPRATPWPHWRPAPSSSTYSGTPKPKQAPVAKSGKPKVVGPTTKSLFIGNVGFKVTEKMIQDVFASKGFLVDVDLPTDATSNGHAGFGYVHFPSEHPASAAIGALQGAIIDGHSINLEHMDHPPIEEVQATPGFNKETHVTRFPRAELSGVNHSTFEPKIQSSAPAAAAQPSHLNTSDRNNGSSKTEPESSALLDSPNDDPAFSARFPSLLPGTSGEQNEPFAIHGVSPGSRPGAEMSRFPPVSQSDAQLLANNSATMRIPSDEEHDAVTKDTMTQLQKEEQTGSSPYLQLPDNAPGRESPVSISSTECEPSRSERGNADIDHCMSALMDMGYGREEEGGPTRMMVFASAADGSLLDAIDMIEEERRAYEGRASR